MPTGKPSKNSQPTSFDATASAIQRLYGLDPNASMRAGGSAYYNDPADSAAVIFAAIIQTRAIDRLTKAVEKHARVVAMAACGTKSAKEILAAAERVES